MIMIRVHDSKGSIPPAAVGATMPDANGANRSGPLAFASEPYGYSVVVKLVSVMVLFPFNPTAITSALYRLSCSMYGRML